MRLCRHYFPDYICSSCSYENYIFKNWFPTGTSKRLAPHEIDSVENLWELCEAVVSLASTSSHTKCSIESDLACLSEYSVGRSKAHYSKSKKKQFKGKNSPKIKYFHKIEVSVHGTPLRINLY